MLWPIDWALRKVLEKLIPALIALGLLSLAGVDVSDYIDQILTSLGLNEDETGAE